MRHATVKRLTALLVAALLVLAAAPPARAAQQQEVPPADARYYGFVPPNPDPKGNAFGRDNVIPVELTDVGSSALTYLLTVVLGAFCIGAMLKSAKRTHLD